jgi:membrane complex biogenesis BtpA family protein
MKLRPTFVGVIHLPPLPGSPRPSPGLDAIVSAACADAVTLARGGADAVIVENFGDAPFDRDEVPPYTVAAMTRVALAVRAAAPSLRLGVNVLRNDARAALSIAHAAGGHFVRVNVHVGAMVTDQGILEGQARATLLERNRLGASIRIVADVRVKHAVPLGDPDLGDLARDTVHRGLADTVVVTGTGTGRRTDPDEWRAVRDAVPRTPVWVGSGFDPESAGAFPGIAGAIVGTWLHADADLTAPLALDRVTVIRKALDLAAAGPRRGSRSGQAAKRDS